MDLSLPGAGVDVLDNVVWFMQRKSFVDHAIVTPWFKEIRIDDEFAKDLNCKWGGKLSRALTVAEWNASVNPLNDMFTVKYAFDYRAKPYDIPSAWLVEDIDDDTDVCGSFSMDGDATVRDVLSCIAQLSTRYGVFNNFSMLSPNVYSFGWST